MPVTFAIEIFELELQVIIWPCSIILLSSKRVLDYWSKDTTLAVISYLIGPAFFLKKFESCNS